VVVAPPLDSSSTANVLVPVTVGVPEILVVLFVDEVARARPDGRDPEKRLHV